MIFPIPTSTDPTIGDYDQRAVLDGREYGLRFRYNQRSGYWYLDISDADGVLLLAGRKLVRGARILGRSADPRLPAGGMIVTGSADPGLTGLGDTAVLYYVDAATMAELQA